MTGAKLDPSRKYLVPVAHLALADEPDDVHLSVYEWNPRLQEWLTGWAICGRSSTQGRLPDGTQATCAKCLEAKPGYDKVLAEQAQIAAERAAGGLRDQIADADNAHGPGHPLWDALESAIWAAGRPSDRNALRAVLPVIEQHTARLRQQVDDLIRRNAEYANRAIANGQRTETARTELRRVSALHADTERQLRADLAAEVRKREAAETEAKRLSLMVDEYGTGASALTDKIVAVRRLHRPYDDNREQIKRCVTCASREAYPNGVAIHEPWPCPTVRALNTPKET